ncbi:MAG: hypothetical protein AAB459_01825 [Patescibacteria group bacterium]
MALSVINPESDFPRLLFGATYGAMALLGGIFGLMYAKVWGSLRSSLGRAILYLSSGLLFAEFGQIVFSYYNIVSKVDIPYPSLADLGFFGNIPLYILGGLSLAKVLGVRISIKKSPIKLLVGIFLPVVMLASSYLLFLKNYDFTDITNLQVFLDFGYPLGQATYVSIALVILLSVGKMLGGVMKKPIMFLLLAFIAQYIADLNFLYQNYHDTWINGGYGDYLYLIAYFAMAVSLIIINRSFTEMGSAKDKIIEAEGQ